MNCCDPFGKCTQGGDCAARQATPGATARPKAPPFAPGTIEHHPGQPKRRAVWFGLRLALLAASALTGLSFAAGYLWGTLAGA